MVPELQIQKPRVTEIQVRMDCNGCVQKIKKALSGINGIYDLYIDLPQQKITIIGWADTEKIVKAIKKTRKIATICNTEPTESPSQPAESSSQPTEPKPEENAPAPEATQPPPAEAPPAQAGPTEEPPRDIPLPEQPPSEQPPPEATPSPTPTENNASKQAASNPGTKDAGEVHVIYHHPPNYGNRFGSGHGYFGHWDRYHNSPVFLQEPPQPVYVTHSYNTYRPSPYVTEYEYVRSPPRHTHYNRMEHYSGDNHYGNGNITSMFSDENPNACRIV